MLDLFAGLGGASKAMRDRGWDVVTVELDAAHEPDVVADVREYTWPGEAVDLLWASPPCTEFSRESMPWCKTGVRPSMDLVLATLRLVDEVQPRFWILENVQAARPWIGKILGPAKMHTGPVYLWGQLPPCLLPRVAPYKEKLSGKRPDLRSQIPYEISRAIAIAVEAHSPEPT